MIDNTAKQCHTEKIDQHWYIMFPDQTKFCGTQYNTQRQAEADLHFYCTGEDDE